MTEASKGPWIVETYPDGPGYYIYSEGSDCVVAKMDRSKDASLSYQAREEADAYMLAAARALYDAAKALLDANAEGRVAARPWGLLKAAVNQAEGK